MRHHLGYVYRQCSYHSHEAPRILHLFCRALVWALALCLRQIRRAEDAPFHHIGWYHLSGFVMQAHCRSRAVALDAKGIVYGDYFTSLCRCHLCHKIGFEAIICLCKPYYCKYAYLKPSFFCNPPYNLSIWFIIVVTRLHVIISEINAAS